jgi:hypothetical protein
MFANSCLKLGMPFLHIHSIIHLSTWSLKNRVFVCAEKIHCVHCRWLWGLHPLSDVFLNSSTQPVVSAVTFLSFHLGSLISWEPHCRCLSIKCEYSCNIVTQRFSNYGPRTTSGPRGVPLWFFKKDIRKNQIQMNCLSHYS